MAEGPKPSTTEQAAPPAPEGTVAPAGRPSRWRSLAAKLAVSSLATALSLLLAEGLLRLVHPQQLILLRPDIWQPADVLGWRHSPNVDTRVNTGERTVRFRTDGLGHRVGDGQALGAVDRRVLVVGDSFLAALQVEVEETLPARLQAALGEHFGAPVEVVNAAVSGWGPEQYLFATREELERQRYGLVVVFLFEGNDVPERRDGPLPPRPRTPRHQLRLPQNLSRAEWVEALAYPVNDFLEERSHLFVLVRREAWFALMRLGLSARRLPPTLLKKEADSPRWGLTADICLEIAELAREHGAASLFVTIPGAYQVYPELGERYARGVGIDPAELDLDQPSRKLLLELRRRKLEALTLKPALTRAVRRGLAPYGEVDTHWSPAGHEVALHPLLQPVTFLLANPPTAQAPP